MIDSANCPLCCILLFSFQQVCVARSVLSPRSVVKYCTCCSSCFPYISKKAQQRRAAFPEKAGAKSCSLLFPLQQACLEFTGCYMLYLLFKLFSLYQQEDAARTGCFSWKSCRKSCSLLFPLQQACLSSQVVIRCTCCSSCFPISARRISKDGLLFLKKLPQKLFFVVSLAAGLSELTGCYTLYLLFKLFSLYQQEDPV